MIVKYRIVHFCFLLSFILPVSRIQAQAGLRFDVGYSSLSADYHMPEFLAAGYLQDIGDKVSIGLSYRYGIDFEERTGSDHTYSFQSNGDIISFQMDEKNSWQSISYTAKYHFNDCYEGAYVSHSISYLWATHENYITEISVNDIFQYNYNDLESFSTYRDKISLFPFSVDLGYRTDFEDWFYDFYVGFTYLPFGNSADYKSNTLQSAGAKMDYPALSFQVGLCAGIAW